MNHLFFDDFNNLWRTPIVWPTSPRKFVTVYVDKEYVARYEGRKLTHKYEGSLEGMDAPYWIELLRTAPEEWDKPAEAV